MHFRMPCIALVLIIVAGQTGADTTCRSFVAYEGNKICLVVDPVDMLAPSVSPMGSREVLEQNMRPTLEQAQREAEMVNGYDVSPVDFDNPDNVLRRIHDER